MEIANQHGLKLNKPIESYVLCDNTRRDPTSCKELGDRMDALADKLAFVMVITIKDDTQIHGKPLRTFVAATASMIFYFQRFSRHTSSRRASSRRTSLLTWRVRRAANGKAAAQMQAVHNR